MRAIWTGAIGFGLVNIPIKIYSATQSSALDLDMLDRKDNAKGGEKAYQLLLKALEKSKTAGLGSFVMRSAENLALVKPNGNLLLLNKLRFEQEIRASDELKLPQQAKLKKEEMDMALQLIKQHSKPFDISSYKNEYTADLLKIIKQKSKAKHTSIRKISV